MRIFFSVLPFVLPCKYCRTSLTDYMELEPLEPALKNRATLTRWLWKIHNHVNAKLRSQGLLKEGDPSFAAVKKVYEDRVAAGCVRVEFEGWDFLFSIAENHPLTPESKKSTPMEGVPEGAAAASANDRNRWNIMKSDERMEYYKIFWRFLGLVLPFQEWREAWERCGGIRESAVASKNKLVKELWRVRCCLEEQLEFVNREDFEHLCKRVVDHKSGCGKQRRGKTCRRKK